MPLDHTPYPRGGKVPRQYLRTLDPFVALTAVAAATETLLLGVGACQITQRDPIVTAKRVATLNRLSAGRVLFGVGADWNRAEVEHHGTPFERRFGVMRERVEAMRELWTRDVASYSGRYVSFGPSWQSPNPLRYPLLVYVGGNGEQVLDRVLCYGDHWMPNRERADETRIPDLRRRAEETGKERPEVTFFGADLDRVTPR